MGLRQWTHDHGMKEPVPGILKVTAVDYRNGGLWMTGVVTGSGIEPTPVQLKADGPRSKHAAVYRRLDLPVLVDRTDPRRARVQWDAVPDESQLDLMDAARLADQMRAVQDLDAEPRDQVPEQAQDGNIFTTFHTAALDGAVLDLGEVARQALQQVQQAFAHPEGVTWQTTYTYSSDTGEIDSTGRTGASFAAQTPAGEQAEATVLAVHELSAPQPGAAAPAGGVVQLTLEIARMGHPVYKTTTQIAFSTPLKRDRIAYVGARLPVLVNPANPALVLIDNTRLDLDTR